MCGVIVVERGRSRSTYLGHDAYIHDHCLEYRHNYVLFYQLPNSNLFSHCMLFFKRETSSENYGPWVYLYHILKPKNTLLQFYLVYFILYFCLSIYHYEIWSLQLTAKGLTTPFCVGCKYLLFCV